MLSCHKYTGPYNPLDEQLDENDLCVMISATETTKKENM